MNQDAFATPVGVMTDDEATAVVGGDGIFGGVFDCAVAYATRLLQNMLTADMRAAAGKPVL